jgi:hypothetical protein
MIGILLAALAIFIAGVWMFYLGVVVEREPIAVLPGLMLIVTGLVIGGPMWDAYREYGSFVKYWETKGRKVVCCDCGAPVRCVECLTVGKREEGE